MIRKLTISSALVWLGPIALGALGATYKIGLFSFTKFNPELEPAYAFVPPLLFYAVLSISLVWAVIRIVGFGELSLGKRVALALSVTLVVPYSFVRAITVENALVQRHAYCCCCEEVPTNEQTYSKVLAPNAF